jgi:hypothetical protein
MTKSSKKKSTTGTARTRAKQTQAKQTRAKQTPASASDSTGANDNAPLDKQPQLLQQAAVAKGMFLYTDDAWSLRYYDQNDLHFKEREVFG